MICDIFEGFVLIIRFLVEVAGTIIILLTVWNWVFGYEIDFLLLRIAVGAFIGTYIFEVVGFIICLLIEFIIDLIKGNI